MCHLPTIRKKIRNKSKTLLCTRGKVAHVTDFTTTGWLSFPQPLNSSTLIVYDLRDGWMNPPRNPKHRIPTSHLGCQFMTGEKKQESLWIINTTAETFDHDVLEKSHKTLVVVDFWAQWCAPCRALAPVLENLANEYEGEFTLVKANTDEVPEAAGKFRVQGIPAVYGVMAGDVVDFFQGALPDDQIRSWLERLFAARTLAEARQLEERSSAGAEAKYRTLIEQIPDDPFPKIGLARTLFAQERIDECQDVIDELEKRGFLEPEAEKVKAALSLGGRKGEDIAELRMQAGAEPNNFELQLRLAETLAGAEDYERALQICLAVVERDKNDLGDSARQVMIDIFRVLPDDSKLTTTYRRKLSTALY